MPRYYSPSEKAEALACLAENRGSVTVTARQLGIAERTLRHWRRQRWLKEKALPSLPILPTTPVENRQTRQSAELPPFEDEFARINYLRRQMLDDLLSMALELRQDIALATPYQRIVLIPRLLDRLMKLDEHLKPYQPASEGEIDYIIEGSETFELDSPGIVDFRIINGETESKSLTGLDIESAMHYGEESNNDLRVRVNFWVPHGKNNERYMLIWSGFFTPADQRPWAIEEAKQRDS